MANDWLGFKETLDPRQHLTKEDKPKTFCLERAAEGISAEFLSASTQLFPGTVKSFNADTGDIENCDDSGLVQGGSCSDWYDGCSDWYDGCSDGDCYTIGDNDGNNINSSGCCGSGDKIGNGDCENDLYEKSDDDNDGDDNDSGDDSENDVLLSNMNNLQQTLTCLIRLRYSIERMSSKGLFPYPVTTLVKVMEYIETLYEGEG